VNDSCIPEQDILAVTRTESLHGLVSDGILGLAPSTSDTTDTSTTLFINNLELNGVINNKVFSFLLTKDTSQ